MNMDCDQRHTCDKQMSSGPVISSPTSNHNILLCCWPGCLLHIPHHCPVFADTSSSHLSPLVCMPSVETNEWVSFISGGADWALWSAVLIVGKLSGVVWTAGGGAVPVFTWVAPAPAQLQYHYCVSLHCRLSCADHAPTRGHNSSSLRNMRYQQVEEDYRHSLDTAHYYRTKI